MAKKWRPEDWQNPYEYVIYVGTKLQEADIYLSQQCQLAFEAGADAMYDPAYNKGKEDGKKAARRRSNAD